MRHDAAGNADDGGVRRDFFQDDGARADLCAFSDGEPAQNLCARADDDVFFNGGVALALLFARAAEGDALIDDGAALHLCRFADDDARRRGR